MENETQLVSVGMEDTIINGPGRAKHGLLWLKSKEAEEMGLSLDDLIHEAIVNPVSAEAFDLAHGETCALGYAGDPDSYYEVQDIKGHDWVVEHGFGLRSNQFAHLTEQIAAYQVLTEQWRTQLQAEADERGQSE
jgi:hypothetical protein